MSNVNAAPLEKRTKVELLLQQTKPFGFLQATQDDRKWEFFMSDFEWTASAESGSDRKIMLLDNIENL